MAKISLKKSINIGRIISRLVTTIIAIYVGGTIVTEVGDVLLGKYGPFFPGLELIGYSVASGTVTNNVCALNTTATNWYLGEYLEQNAVSGCIYDVSGTGILMIIGIVGIASIVMEFIKFSL